MSYVWQGDGTPPPRLRVGPVGWLVAGARAGVLVPVLLAGLAVLLPLRAVERPFAGARRPLSARVPQLVSRAALAILGLRLERRGRPPTVHGAVVSNHVSWLDIFALNAAMPITFVAKAEVARWPFIGWLARATGTLFIRRDRRGAAEQVAAMRARLAAGQVLLFFPEGTSSDGQRVLAFRSTLFASFMTDPLRAELLLQPVSLRYQAPAGRDPRFFGWWGDMALGPHLFAMLANWRGGRVQVVFHAPLRVADFPDRKTLARACEETVRAGLAPEGGGRSRGRAGVMPTGADQARPG